jgi:hypothetical protein
MREVGSSMFSQEKIGEADMQNKGLMSFVILDILVISFISACGLNSTNQQHITPSPVSQTSIEGVFYYEITWKPHGWSFLRFFSDGTVINNNTNVGLTPHEAWNDIQSLLTFERAGENWHGKYVLNDEQLIFTLYPPGSTGPDGGATSECQFTGDKVSITKFNNSEYHMEYLSLQP